MPKNDRGHFCLSEIEKGAKAEEAKAEMQKNDRGHFCASELTN